MGGCEMASYYHYTNSESLVKIVKEKMLLSSEGSGFAFSAAESVFLTGKDPIRFNRRQILENNYERWWKKRSKVSWFIKVTVDEENMFKFKDSSLPEKSRDLVLHEGDLNLSDYSWQFGRTPAHLDKQLSTSSWDIEDPEEDAAEEKTAKRPDIAGHPNNEKYKIPSGQVSDSFLKSLRPGTKMPLKKQE